MNVTRSLLDDIKMKQLKWCGNVQRMEEEEENEEDLKLRGRKGLEGCWGKRD